MGFLFSSAGYFQPNYEVIDGEITYKKSATGDPVADKIHDDFWETLDPQTQQDQLQQSYDRNNPPDWANWQLAMLQDPAWNQIAAQGGHLVSALYVLISQIQNSPATLENIVALFQLLTKNVSQAQKQAWAKSAKAHNLPDDFVSAITLN